MFKFNVNNYVLVKLTEQGRQIYFEHYSVGGMFKKMDKLLKTNEPDANGYSRFQLHDLMHIFGNYMGNGMSIAFETDILIPEEYLESVGEIK